MQTFTFAFKACVDCRPPFRKHFKFKNYKKVIYYRKNKILKDLFCVKKNTKRTSTYRKNKTFNEHLFLKSVKKVCTVRKNKT